MKSGFGIWGDFPLKNIVPVNRAQQGRFHAHETVRLHYLPVSNVIFNALANR